MLFRLALAMGRTLAELRSVLTYAEFQEWFLYYQIEPWGQERADLRAGQICATVANFAGKTLADNAEKLKPLDFMPYSQIERKPAAQDIEPQELTDEQLADWADAAIYGLLPEGEK